MKKKLAAFISHPATDWTVVCLIFTSIFLLLVEAVVPVDNPSHGRISLVGDVITWIFVVELSIRFYVAPVKRVFWTRYWLDVLAVLPVLRAFRVLRVLRLARALRAGALVSRRVALVGTLLREGGGVYLVILGILAVVVLSSALAMRFIEGTGADANADFNTLDKAVWWSLMSIVAGEPIEGQARTAFGRIVTLLVMLGGLTVFAMLIGVATAVMVDKLKTRMEATKMELCELRGHVIIGGWNRAAHLIIEELQSDPEYRHSPIVVVAEFDETPNLDGPNVNRAMVYFLAEDYTRIETLEKINVPEASICILLADKTKARSDQDRDARTVLAALSIEKLNTDIFTCVELLNRDNESHLRMAGVEEVVVGDEYAGSIMASASRNRGLVGMLNELLTSQYGNQFYKVPVPDELVGCTALDAHRILKEQHDAVLVSIETENGDGEPRRNIVNPPADHVLQAGDRLLTIARSAPGG